MGEDDLLFKNIKQRRLVVLYNQVYLIKEQNIVGAYKIERVSIRSLLNTFNSKY
uniref:Uncharacterized protein n=1 Tax=Xenopus tropicalis TaxID=8364 RepID=A0A1B8XS89_XENTR